MVSIDYEIDTNTVSHKTSEYNIVEEELDGNPRQLVVRRGQPFDIKITFNATFEKEFDHVKVVCSLGKSFSLVLNWEQ